MPMTLTFDVIANVTVPPNPLVLVAPPPGNPAKLPDGPPGSQFQCVVTGGTPGYTFTSANLPTSWGLTPDGLLTRGASGQASFKISVKDSSTP